MVSLISDKTALDFLPADPFAARISALLKTYGSEHSFAMFWLQITNDIPTAAISRVDGNMTLCCLENADFEELSYFIDAVGFSSITFDEKFFDVLGIKPQKSSFIVEYCGGAEQAEDILFDYDKKEIYSLLCSCGFELGDYSAFLADVCSRLNKGTAVMAAKDENGKLCACAFSLFEGDKSVLLGAVATKESARGKGYASKLVGTLACMKSQKRVFLFCRNDGLADFYGKIGFKICGRWAVCENKY